MTNRIDKIFSNAKNLKIITHVVAGYPDIKTSKRIIQTMADNGVSLIEIQIPFSDPLADGPTITRANQHTLDLGVKVEDCFHLAEEMSVRVDVPLLFMTYANIAYQMGLERFVTKSAEAGISGLILPDIPFDETHMNYLDITRKQSLHPILVVSPDVKTNRLKTISKRASGFIYTTLKVGITGAQKKIDPSGLMFIDTIRKASKLPVAAGFGISSKEHINQLRGKVDAAVIGSHLIELFHKGGIEKIAGFLKQLV